MIVRIILVFCVSILLIPSIRGQIDNQEILIVENSENPNNYTYTGKYKEDLGAYLKKRLENERKFTEISRIVDSLFATLPDEGKYGGQGLPKYKHWQRELYFLETRLNGKGEVFNFHEIDHKEALQVENLKSLKSKWSYLEWQQEGITKSHGHPKTPLQPNGKGRVDRIDFHPTDENIIYAGTPNSGIWKTIDGGQTWEHKNNGLPNLGIAGIAVDKSGGDTIFVLTGTGDNPIGGIIATSNHPCKGVYRSNNGGDSWFLVDTLPTPDGQLFKGFEITQNPLNHNQFMVATSRGLMYSDDKGANWDRVLEGWFYEALFHPSIAQRFYAAKSNEIYYSDNTGTSWNQSNISFDINPKRIALAISPQASYQVYAFAGGPVTEVNSTTYLFPGFYRSNIWGTSFHRLLNSPNLQGYNDNGFDTYEQSDFDHCMVIHPHNKDSIMLFSSNGRISTDGGYSFSALGSDSGKNIPKYLHTDHHEVKFHPLNDKLYIAHDGGISVSADYGNTWQDISDGIYSTMVYNLTLHHESSFRMGVGLQDNGYKYKDTASTEFTHIGGGDGFDWGYAGSQRDIIYKSTNESLYRDTISIFNSKDITPPGSKQFGVKIGTTIQNENFIMAGKGDKTSVSNNKGAQWGTFSVESRRGMDVHQFASNKRIMIAGKNGIWRYDNLQGLIYVVPEPFTADRTYTCISMDNTDFTHVAVSTGGYNHNDKLYVTENEGGEWENLTPSLQSFIGSDFSINCVELHDNILFVGTNNAIYETNISNVNNIQWNLASINIPKVPITDIEVNPNDGTIVVGTWGFGIYSIRFCPGAVTLTEELIGEIDYHSNDIISTSSEIEGLDVNKVNMRSGQEVQLLPGFHAKTTSNYTASIQNCVD